MQEYMNHTDFVPIPVEWVLDELVCDIFGVAPLSEDERTVRQILNEIIGESVEKASLRKKSVILPAKTRKKHFSIFDEIPD